MSNVFEISFIYICIYENKIVQYKSKPLESMGIVPVLAATHICQTSTTQESTCWEATTLILVML